MESYSQPWTVVNKYDQYECEPKTYEYYATGMEGQIKKPHHFEGCYEKPQYCGNGKWVKPETCGNGRWEQPEIYGQGKWEKPEFCGQQGQKWVRPAEFCGQKYDTCGYKQLEKPEFYGQGKWEQREFSGNGKWEQREFCGQQGQKWVRPTELRGEQGKMEGIYGEWEKVCDSLERCQLERPTWEGETSGLKNMQPRWKCSGKQCCDEEMVKLVKDVINILIGAEQSYIQLGFLCMDENFTLVNTSEYFRLCGLRMRWLAQGLIGRSVRLFNVNEWINNTSFQNWFKVPTKEELASNDYTSVIKTFFKIAVEAETRLVEHMNILGEKMIKIDWVNNECRFDGFKWFVNFVLPYQTEFVREMTGHFRNIEMCNNGFVFDKCEMYPLVQKIEQFIHYITKINTTGLNNMPVWEKNAIIPVNKKW